MLNLARVAVAPLLLGFACAQSFVNYESPLVQPIRLSADGLRLYAAHTADHRLAVYSLADANSPVLLAEIPVGLEPVSVNPRTDDEVWVVNHLSDSVSVVSVSAGCVIATLHVKDEPSDVVFAGGKAFVTAAASDRVDVFDAVTRAPLGSVDIFGKDPRALAVDATGTRVYAVVQRSGNGTTVVPNQPQSTPTNPALPTPPAAGRIVRASDPAWASQIPYTLPDNAVAEIDVATLTVIRYFRAVGTTNTSIAVDEQSGDLWVANTEARNLVDFEPGLRGHAIDSRLTRITTGVTPSVTPIDLNPGLDYQQLPNPTALGSALSEPYGVAIDGSRQRIYVAAQGTDRIGVLDLAGNVIARIEVGDVSGAQVDTLHKRGPRALALSPSTQRLYVLNKLSSTIAVIDTASATRIAEVPLGSFDPTPASIRDGRRFLYDAKLSGNGTMSCASCHIDGDMDGIAWNLGDPAGTMANAPSNTLSPFNLLNPTLVQFHPMKGAMTTQTLKGLAGSAPLHWRADRTNFQAFNGAFASLMGGAPLSTANIDLFAAFGTSIAFPPNPNQPLNRQYLTTPAGNNQAAGLAAFNATATNLLGIFPLSCATCHSLPTGSNRQVITAAVLQEPQQMKVPQLRNMYRKVGFSRTAGPQKLGFGYTHDGALDTLTSFLAQPVFNPWAAGTKDDIVTFLLAFDTGTAPTVGYQTTLDQLTSADPGVIADLNLLVARALAGDIDLTVAGRLSGELHGLRFDTATQTFRVDQSGRGPFTLAQLQTLAQGGSATLTFTGTAPGTGTRTALDRDLDGALDVDELALAYGIATAGCNGTPLLGGNSEPRVGNAAFALIGNAGPASGPGLLLIGFGAASQPVLGIQLLVDPSQGPPIALTVGSDARRTAFWRLAIPADPGYAGIHLFSQFIWVDPCGPAGFSASAGLDLTVRAQ